MRKLIAALVSFVLVAGVMVAGSAPSAIAAAGDLAFGRVVVDSNRNGAINSGPVGENDSPLAGAKVTLRGTNPDHPGWTVTTAADGTWSFPADADRSASPGPFTVTLDVKCVNGNVYLMPAAPTAGLHDFTRVSGQTQQGVSASIPAGGAPVELNALPYPTWSTSVISPEQPDGMNKLAIWTGTTPFDANDSEPGFDAGQANNRVRTADVVKYSWSVATKAEVDLGSSPDVWFEQKLLLGEGAKVTFGEMPSSEVCRTGSQIVASPSGTVLKPRQALPAGTTAVTLLCNLGPMGASKDVNLIDTQVFVSADSINGATFTTEVRSYAATADGVTTARPDGPHPYGPFEITAAPRYDLEKSGSFMYSSFSPLKIDGKDVLDADG